MYVANGIAVENVSGVECPIVAAMTATDVLIGHDLKNIGKCFPKGKNKLAYNSRKRN
jgi:hypothetical protein